MKRKFINQIALTTAFALAPLFAQAYVFEADGIYYNITSLSDLTVEVTYETTSYNSYSGKITIPDTVTYNGKTYAVTSIGSSAFRGCTSLTSITIPDAVTSIGDYAFFNCTGLTSITVPDAVTSIGAGAFSQCTSLTSITIPDAVTSIESQAFYNCTSLTSITIGDAVTSIGIAAFSHCTSLTSITIPDAVTSIGQSAFNDCTSLTNVTIGDAVTSIGQSAFYYCTSLTNVTIGEAVTSIGSYAFNDCSILVEIYCLSSTPPTCASTNCFTNYFDATLHVPADAVDTYSSTYVWKNFASIVGDISVDDSTIVEDSNDYDDTSDDASSPSALTVHVKDGSKVTFLLSERPAVTFSDGYLLITSDDADASYPLSDVVKFTFGDVDEENTGIDSLPVDETTFGYDGGAIVVTGLKPGSTAKVYTIGGMMVHSESISDGSWTYPLSSLSSGIYIININGKSFKISKK